MTQQDLFQIATSSQQDTLVNPSVKQVSAKAKKTHATSGRTSAKLLHPKDPLGLFSKTFMVTSAWDSTRCSLTWSPKATPQGRLLFQLSPSAPHTKVTESGLWATPRTTDVTGGPRQLDEKGRRVSKTNPNLKFVVKQAQAGHRPATDDRGWTTGPRCLTAWQGIVLWALAQPGLKVA